uniref:DNA repair protein RAD50-like isoform X1 n=2 Tax=Crassostrea virginica TaxID=6565 RepID=A0A8B8DK18_CRAVI|nr:DNA repair protein RAD50-like isoform X1 [Crassostrea virginica]XP_022328067.1 DNA repair protein RAD50-like isoform X1 [Crassostrea virginica]
MSKIEKMSIQGIRSFGPDDSDKGIISFFTPLTLILGPNGTGKTTIIECLKYMTTGVMPPGSKGGAFIHDPKVAHERQVKAQIRLQFRDVTNNRMVIQRIMEATQKVKKIEMKTLDGVITCYDVNGEKKSISSKCAEIDREMITSLGVSKPVLENVIFCHQEDSNWPLSEGKALKEKFDAIFASTRYVKALETIRKVKQTQDQDLKLYKQEVTHLKQLKDKSEQLEADKNERETKMMACRESVEKIESKLRPVIEKLDQIGNQSDKIYKIQTNIEKHRSEMKMMEGSAADLREQIKNEFQGSVEELKRKIAEFENMVQERQETMEQFQLAQRDLNKELEKLGQERGDLLMEVGKLEQESERYKGNMKRRDEEIKKLATKYDIEGYRKGELTDEQYRTFMDIIKTKIESLLEEGKKVKVEFDEKDSNMQQKLDDVRDKKTKLEQNERLKKDLITENTQKIRQINQKLSEVEASAGRRDQITRELKRAEFELAKTEKTVDVNKIKQEIECLSKEKSKLDATISDLSSEMNRLHLQSSARAQLDVLKKDKVTKEEQIRRLRAKQEDTLTYLLGHVPARNVRGELDEYIGKQTDSVKRLSQDIQKIKSVLSSKEAEKKMLGESLKKKEAELKNVEEKVFSVCGSQNFDEGLSSLQEKMSTAQDQRGSLLGAEHFFQKYVNDLEKQEPCCPLCHREFDTDQEVKELIIELKNKLRMVPSKLVKTEKDLDEYRTKYDAMMQLKPLKENITVLEDQEVPELKNKLKKINEDISRLREDVQTKEDDLHVQEQDDETAKQIQPDIVMMDRYQGEVTELEKKISTEGAKLSGGDSDRSLQDVINEKEDLQMKVDSSNKQLESMRQKINLHTEQVQQLKSDVNKLTSEKLQIDSDLQQRYKLEEDKAKLLSENDQYGKEVTESQDQIKPLQTQLEKLRKEKEKILQDKEERMEYMKNEVDKVKNDTAKVKNVNLEIKSYNQSGKADTLADNKNRLNKITEKAAKKEEELKDTADSLNELRDELAKNTERERELTDNLRLRRHLQDIEDKKKSIEELEQELGGIDAKHLERERRRLLAEQQEFLREKQMSENRKMALHGELSSIVNELKSEMYKNAGIKYRDKMIILKTTELASSDLEKYYKALDKAIMSYHNMKMDEINKIIRELWRNTYKGNDIETIEIRSDEDEAGLMKTRRTYNYRVVMIKGDTALDMRGRCSAGQKVLASLIIRMALAETFCLNCGILALDEPTTNLDRENIESLALALVEIIKSRSSQKNFQLVVITHDEDFVELLGRSDYVDEFWKVRKDANACSKLVKAKVEDLHSR